MDQVYSLFDCCAFGENLRICVRYDRIGSPRACRPHADALAARFHYLAGAMTFEADGNAFIRPNEAWSGYASISVALGKPPGGETASCPGKVRHLGYVDKPHWRDSPDAVQCDSKLIFMVEIGDGSRPSE